MKVVMKRPDPPALWEWLRSRLPPTLVAYTREEGYGGVYGITVKQRGMPGLLGRWFGPSVAIVEGDTVELQHPEWSSDFIGLLETYEAAYSKETTLRICTSDMTTEAP